MTDFVDPTDPGAVERVLAAGLAGLGPEGLAQQLTKVPGLLVRPGRRAGLLRGSELAQVEVGDRRLQLGPRGQSSLEHVVGGVRLARDAVAPAALPGVLAALVVRAVEQSGARDQVSVLLTSLRDALAAGA
ncbi:MAG: DUF5073 family protein [Mycobacteriales bacterium]